jgi:N utilization substance protein B
MQQAEKELKVSLERSYQMFFLILVLLFDLVDYAAERIRLGREKKIPTWEELHPNERFVHNRLIKELRQHEGIKKYVRDHSLGWIDHSILLKKLYNTLIATEAYKEYMSGKEDGYKNDRMIVKFILSELLPHSEDLQSSLEEQSIYWNDELEFVLSALIRFLELFPPHKGRVITLPPMYKSREDEQFALQLLHKSIIHRQEYTGIIEQHTKNWEVDRIARLDMLILIQAITEILHFSDIPVRVSINEYIEIAKYYSTGKSPVFVNGILDKIVSDLRKDNKIHKEGRGLIGEV